MQPGCVSGKVEDNLQRAKAYGLVLAGTFLISRVTLLAPRS